MRTQKTYNFRPRKVKHSELRIRAYPELSCLQCHWGSLKTSTPLRMTLRFPKRTVFDKRIRQQCRALHRMIEY